MKICRYCGAENFDTQSVCEKCNRSLERIYYKKTFHESGLTKASKVILKIESIILGATFLVFFLFWLLFIVLTRFNTSANLSNTTLQALNYMIVSFISFIACLLTTITYHEKVALRKPIRIIFIIFVLLFICFPAGILMLIDYIRQKKKA